MLWFHLLLPLLFSSVFVLKYGQNPWQFLLFIVGVLSGFGLILLDRFLHAVYVDPDTEFSLLVRDVLKKKQWISLVKLLAIHASTQQVRLITRSSIFLLSFLMAAFYVVTSSTGALGIGMVLGVGLHYCLDFLLYRADKDAFSEQFLWQLKRKFSQDEINMFVSGYLVLFSLVVLLALR